MFTHIRLHQFYYSYIRTSEPPFLCTFYEKFPWIVNTHHYNIINMNVTSLHIHATMGIFFPNVMILIHSPTMCKFLVRWWMNWRTYNAYIYGWHIYSLFIWFVCVSILPLRIVERWKPLHTSSRHYRNTQHIRAHLAGKEGW